MVQTPILSSLNAKMTAVRCRQVSPLLLGTNHTALLQQHLLRIICLYAHQDAATIIPVPVYVHNSLMTLLLSVILLTTVARPAGTRGTLHFIPVQGSLLYESACNAGAQGNFPIKAAIGNSHWSVVEAFLSHYKEHPPAADSKVSTLKACISFYRLAGIALHILKDC